MFKTIKKIIKHTIKSGKSITTVSNTKITLNGNDVDPNSKRGKKIVKASNEALEDMGNVMDEMHKTMNKLSEALK